jgi:hypothetical protein
MSLIFCVRLRKMTPTWTKRLLVADCGLPIAHAGISFVVEVGLLLSACSATNFHMGRVCIPDLSSNRAPLPYGDLIHTRHGLVSQMPLSIEKLSQ